MQWCNTLKCDTATRQSAMVETISVDLPVAVVDINADHLFLPPVSRKENIGTGRKRRIGLKSVYTFHLYCYHFE
jgi:hypothetical protein